MSVYTISPGTRLPFTNQCLTKNETGRDLMPWAKGNEGERSVKVFWIIALSNQWASFGANDKF